MLEDLLLGARRWVPTVGGGPWPLCTKLPTWPWVGASQPISRSLSSRRLNGTTHRHLCEGFNSVFVHRYGSPSSETPRWRKRDCQRIIPSMSPVSPLIPPPTVSTRIAVMQSVRPHVLGTEARRARDEQEAARLLRAGVRSTGRVRSSAGRAPQGRGAGSGAAERGCISVCQDRRFAFLLCWTCVTIASL